MNAVLHIVKARYEGDYRLWLRFNDGAEGIVDLKDELFGEMFAPLRKLDAFRDFKVDPELETVVWSNGADFAPEFFRRRLRVRPLKAPSTCRRKVRP